MDIQFLETKNQINISDIEKLENKYKFFFQKSIKNIYLNLMGAILQNRVLRLQK